MHANESQNAIKRHIHGNYSFADLVETVPIYLRVFDAFRLRYLNRVS